MKILKASFIEEVGKEVGFRQSLAKLKIDYDRK